MAMIRVLVFLCACIITTCEATVMTDQLASHLATLEARLTAMENKNSALESQNLALQQKLLALQTLNSSLHHSIDTMTTDSQQHSDNLMVLLHNLQTQYQALTYDLVNLQALRNQSLSTKTPSVSFHIRMSSHDNSFPHDKTPLILTDVRNNEGNGYNPRTGKFTAPVSGTYCILASTEPSMTKYGGIFLMVDNTSYDYMETKSTSTTHQAMSVHMVHHLNAGQQVWLRSNGHSVFWYSPTTFSGFLINTL